MTLLIIGIVLMGIGGVCVYLAGVSAAASAAIVAGVYTIRSHCSRGLHLGGSDQGCD